MNYKGKTLEELDFLTIEYIKRHRDLGGSSEFDTSINDISRAKIDKFKEVNGKCYLGNINHYDIDRRNPDIKLVEYEGQLIYNFQYSFVIPCEDETVIWLINEYNREKKEFDCRLLMKEIEEINNRIEELGGEFLFWS